MESQKNSLQEEICELHELCKRMEEMELDESEFGPPASEEEILDWERLNGISIPESYKEWLRFSNGSVVMGNAAMFFGLNGIEITNKYIPDELVVIGELVGDGELLCFSKKSGKIVKLLEGRRDEEDSILGVINWLIRLAKDALAEDENTQQSNESRGLSKEATAKLLAIFEAKKKSPEGLTDEQERLVAKIKSEMYGGK